jgi:hypothetical protein
MPVLLPEERPPAPVTLSEAAARQQDPQIRQETKAHFIEQRIMFDNAATV